MIESVDSFFATLQDRIDPAKLVGINATFQFIVTGEGGGDWYVRLTDGAPSIVQGVAEDPNITLTSGASDWLDIISGRLNGQTAVLTGKLKLKGDVTLAMKLQSIMG